MITQEQVEVLRGILKSKQDAGGSDAVRRLRARHCDALAAAIATIERLPQHADTLERFVPGRDPAWIVPDGETEPQIARAAIGGHYGDGIGDVWVMLDVDGNVTNAQPYSTSAAAAKAVPHA